LLTDSDFQKEIELQLASFAQQVCESAPSVQSYLELHPSVHYSLSVNLVFTPTESRELELAVIGFQQEAETGWVFDAIDRTSVVLAEASVAASTDEADVIDALSSFLREAEPLVVAALSR
jgi:hypothetical protein